jgi:hypothetical protein
MQSIIKETIFEVQKLDQEIKESKKKIEELQNIKNKLLSNTYKQFITETHEKNDLIEDNFVLFQFDPCGKSCYNENTIKIVGQIVGRYQFDLLDFTYNYLEDIGFWYNIQVIFPSNDEYCSCATVKEYNEDGDYHLYKRSELKKISKKEFLEIKKEYLEKEIQKLEK